MSKRMTDVDAEQYAPARPARLAAHNALGEAKARALLRIGSGTSADIAFLENQVRGLDEPYGKALADVGQRIEARTTDIATKEAGLAELENRLWEMHGDATKVKEYIELHNQYVKAETELRAVRYPRRFVKQQDHAFVSSYMNLRDEPDAGFQKGAPIYILKQLPDIQNMIVGTVRAHITMPALAPVEEVAPTEEAPVVATPIPIKRKAPIKLKKRED